MTDIAITVARENWQTLLNILGRENPRGRIHSFNLYGEARPPSNAGDLLYVISHGRLRCAFQIERIFPHRGHWQIVATFLRPVTLAGYVAGYPQCRRIWWNPRHDQLPFDAWRTEGVSSGVSV